MRNPSGIPLISISGSLGSIIVCIIVIIYAYKKFNNSLLVISFFKIFIEIANWLISPISKSGDAYVLYEYLGITNYLFPAIVLFSIFGLGLFGLYKTFGRNWM
jgi:hypothetical protein